MKTCKKEEFEQQDAFGVGAPNDAYARYNTGQSYLKPLTIPGQCPVFLAKEAQARWGLRFTAL